MESFRSSQSGKEHQKQINGYIRKLLSWTVNQGLHPEKVTPEQLTNFLEPWRNQEQHASVLAVMSATTTFLFAAYGRKLGETAAVIEARELAAKQIERGEATALDLRPVFVMIAARHSQQKTMKDSELHTIVGFLLWAEHALRGTDVTKIPLMEAEELFQTQPQGTPLDQAKTMSIQVLNPKEQILKAGSRAAWSMSITSTHEPDCEDAVYQKTKTHEWYAELVKRHKDRGNLPALTDRAGKQIYAESWAMPCTTTGKMKFVSTGQFKYESTAVKPATMTKKIRTFMAETAATFVADARIMRKTAATYWYRAAVDSGKMPIEQLQGIMRHQSLDTLKEHYICNMPATVWERVRESESTMVSTSRVIRM